MKEDKNKEKAAESSGGSSLLVRISIIIGGTLLLTVGISAAMFKLTEDILTSRLQDRLVAIASTAASQFDEEDIKRIQNIRTYDDVETVEFERIVEKLDRIRSANENIQYSYLMRKTDDPNIVEFIADAYSLLPEEELDANGDGELQDDEYAPWPGDPYEVHDFPVLRDEAFENPAVDEELQPDQWGLIMAAYAPIKDKTGNTVAIVGIDVLVDDFNQRTQETLTPFLIFIFVLVILLAISTLLLAGVWNDRVKAMREIDQQKDELLSIVSHQLATPISSMKWYLEMMLDGDVGKLTKEQTEHVTQMQYSAANLSDLVGMILDVSRIQLGRMKVDRTDLDLNEFFKEITAVIDAKAAEQKVEFIKKIPENLPVAMLDRRLMRMTLENLLSNAVKYTPEGGRVTLDVKVKDNKLFYTVKDTGMGIPKSEHHKIFGKLFRASNVQKVDGNGFGLYVAKGAVESQGGTIRFDSAEGKGTTFYVEFLPLISPEGKKGAN